MARGCDGLIQGLLDTIGLPYTGSGVLASALAMDKEVAKQVLAAGGLDVPRGVVVRGAGRADLEAARSVGLPSFVKPVGSGSSVGASIVKTDAELAPAIEAALKHDERVLVEEQILGRELTVPVIGNDDPRRYQYRILTQARVLRLQRQYDAPRERGSAGPTSIRCRPACAGPRRARAPRASLPRHVANGLHVVEGPHGRARGEHDPRHDR